MKSKIRFILLFLLVLGMVVAVLLRRSAVTTHHPKRAVTQTAPASSSTTMPMAMHVPAHYETAPPLSSLAATLPPEGFSGKAREAYQAVRDAPQLIAQMPCYCHCDMSLGHKSLHSCFEDDHAATCATCIEEALMAYRLQKQGLSPTQIRLRIIERYSGQ